MLRQFTIDEQYITDVRDYREWGMFDNIPADELTPEQLFKIIKGEDRCSSLGHHDHDEFTKLRNQLEEQGYITTQRGWSNGDRVIKGFRLNEFTLKKGDKFLSACAMKGAIQFARSRNRKNIGF